MMFDGGNEHGISAVIEAMISAPTLHGSVASNFGGRVVHLSFTSGSDSVKGRRD